MLIFEFKTSDDAGAFLEMAPFTGSVTHRVVKIEDAAGLTVEEVTELARDFGGELVS